MRNRYNSRRLIQGVLAVGAAACWVSGCSPKAPEPKDDKKAVAPEWEYVVPSDTSGFTVRVKVDTIHRVLRWIEDKHGWLHVNYHQCRETESLSVQFWLFDDQNWHCAILNYPAKLEVMLEMRDGRLARFDGENPTQAFERRRRLPPFVPSAKP